MQQLTEAGVNAIQPGIESMHDSALKLLNKGNSAAINVQLLKWAREFGIAVIWNFLAGIPGESSAWYAEVLEWLPWIVHLQPPSRLGTIRYDRFSLYHERAVDYGLALSPNRAYFHVYPLSPEAMADLAYYFEEERHLDDHECAEVNGRKFDGKGSRFSSEQIELGKWVERWIELFKSETPPVLQTIDDDGERLRIIDTRPCATDGEITLEGLAYQVYRACDRVLTQRELIDALRRNCGIDVSWSDIQPVADELVSRRILLAQNGRLLNLAVRGSMPPLPNYRELPLGYLDILSFLHDARKQLESQLQQSIL